MRLNCNARIREINSKSSILIVSTAMGIEYQKILKWFDLNGCEARANIPCDIEHFKSVINKYTSDIIKKNKLTGFISKHRCKIKSKVISGLEVFSVSNVSDIVFDYCCHPKSGDEIMAFLEKGKVHVHHKMCSNAFKKLQEKTPMVFIRWSGEHKYNYRLIASLHNEKGALAKFLTYLVKLNIDITSIELGKDSDDYVKYCELGFESKEADINSLRAKISTKIKIIHLIRTDDAYR
jgi:GTP pyrophosphokinase